MTTQGRCPDCGEAVLIERTPGIPAKIPPHQCGSRACEYERCRVRTLMEEMVQFGSGAWYCPEHGLLLATKDLISHYRVAGEADWSAICEIIADILPELVAKVDARSRRSSHTRPAR